MYQPRHHDPGDCQITAARALDVESGEVLSPATLRVIGGRIESLESGRPSGDVQVIDLGEATLLPGLHDNHCHLMLKPEDFEAVIYKRSSATKTLEAMLFAWETLMAGFTTVRDPGDCDWQNGLVDLRNAIASGKIPGPRLLVAPHYLSITGGHGDANDYACDLCMRGIGRIVDGVEDMRKAVREEVKLGADWIKIFASGGVISMGDDPSRSAYSFEEIRIAAEEAHRLGRKITAHAHGAEAVRYCAEAGFDSIEHCTMIDDAGIEAMKGKGIYCVPTLYCLDYIQLESNPLKLPAQIVEKAATMRSFQRERFSKVVESGVPVAYGTDIGVFPHGENWRDFPIMVECGMSEMEAIRTATIYSARMNGIDAETGSLSPGKSADVIAVAGNPLQSIEALSEVSFVMKAGIVYERG
ncbi:MAG: amidohydrolase family protein [Planctomycetota bacterium]